MTELADYAAADGVAVVTLNRPERLNAMTDELLEALLAALERAAADDGVRAVVLCGAGRAFCAGGDLKEGVGGGVGGDGPVPTASGNLRRYMRTAQLLREMPKPTIAAVQGACAGAGLSLACAADLRVAAPSAVFATAFVSVGLSGDFGGTWALTGLVGSARAREAYLLADRIPAPRALAIGLVSEVVDDEDALLGRAGELAARLAALSVPAVRAVKANLNDAQEVGFREALEREAFRHIECSRTPEAREATQAFLEKRAPVF